MSDLLPLAALGKRTAQVDTIGGITCAEVTTLAMVSVTARKNRRIDCGERLSKFVATPLPDSSQSITGQMYQTIWSGQDQWIVCAKSDTHPRLINDIKYALGGAASVTDQSDIWAVFDLTGPQVDRALERLCNVNLDCFGASFATFTSIHSMRCMLVAQPDGRRIFGPRSSARSLHHAVLTTLRAL